jgi:hypothetical protein
MIKAILALNKKTVPLWWLPVKGRLLVASFTSYGGGGWE